MTHIRICPYGDGTVKYFPWNDEDYGDEIPPREALSAIAKGATAEIALVDPDEENLPAIQQSVYESNHITFNRT